MQATDRNAEIITDPEVLPAALSRWVKSVPGASNGKIENRELEV